MSGMEEKNQANPLILKILIQIIDELTYNINEFSELTISDFPDRAIFKEMGIANIEPNKVFEQFKKSFKVNKNEA